MIMMDDDAAHSRSPTGTSRPTAKGGLEEPTAIKSRRPARRRKHTFKGLRLYANDVLDQSELLRMEEATAPRGAEGKYLKTELYLNKLWKPVVLLGLADAPRPLRILDIGTGGGHFPFICNFPGHEAFGLDRGDSPFFKAMTKWMDVKTIDHAVRPFKRMPRFAHRFDLVTAFRIGFNVRPDGSLFELPDWTFLLDDLRDEALSHGGRLCLKFNLPRSRVGPQFEDPELAALFAARGERSYPNGRYLIFDPLL